MLKTIKNLLRRNAYSIAVFVTIVIIYLSLSPLKEFKIDISNSDKILHALAYVILTLSWLLAIKKSHNSIKTKLWIGVVIVIFGIIIEVLQSKLTIYRSGEFLDALANTTGITIAILLFDTVFKVKKII